MTSLMIVLKKLGKSFIEGFVGLMTNEKDPHNLMLCFSILKVILVEFDIVGTQDVLTFLMNEAYSRNCSTQYSAISPSPLKRDQMISTV
jgi:hypothetical protein